MQLINFKKFLFFIILLVTFNSKLMIKSSNIINIKEEAEQLSCSIVLCQQPMGFCLENKCKCNKDFSNFNDELQNSQCSYKRKKLLIALLGEMLLPFGFGHFYLEKFNFALLKLVIVLILPMIILFFSTYFVKNGFCDKILTFFFFLNLIIILFWYFTDIILFLSKSYTDGNHEALV